MMKTILLLISTLSFLSTWITAVVLYMPSCFRLRAMIDLIDKNDNLKADKIKWSIGYNLHTVDNWLISIPTSEKYLRYELVTRTIKKINFQRTVLGISTVTLIVSALILLAT